MDFTYKVNEKLLNKDLKLAVYRILQEQFNNTVKYAKASHVNMSLQTNKSKLKVVYKDNGVGFNPTIKKSGLGLKNIQNRAETYRGEVNIKAAIGKGFSSNIFFPLN